MFSLTKLNKILYILILQELTVAISSLNSISYSVNTPDQIAQATIDNIYTTSHTQRHRKFP